MMAAHRMIGGEVTRQSGHASKPSASGGIRGRMRDANSASAVACCPTSVAREKNSRETGEPMIRRPWIERPTTLLVLLLAGCASAPSTAPEVAEAPTPEQKRELLTELDELTSAASK